MLDPYDFDFSLDAEPCNDEDRDPAPACRFCEWARDVKDGSLFTLCIRTNQEVCITGICPCYCYDLLKRVPCVVKPRPAIVDLSLLSDL